MTLGGTRFSVDADDFLNGIPSLHIYHRFAVVFNDEIAEFENANVNGICEERFIGTDGCVELCFFHDLCEG